MRLALAPVFALALALGISDARAQPTLTPSPPPSAETLRPPRVELVVGVPLSIGGTDWAGDPAGYVGLQLGLRLFRAVTPFFEGRLGYGRVDQRMLSLITVGIIGGYPVRGIAYPYARLAFVHQHEESAATISENVIGALLGIATGIRHRAGVQVGLGCGITLKKNARAELVLGPEVLLAYLTYSSGPSLYGQVGLQLGGTVRLF